MRIQYTRCPCMLMYAKEVLLKSGTKRIDIPGNPNVVYKNEWKGWGDWLGTGNIATQQLSFRPFEQAKAFVHTLGLKSSSQWKVYSKSDKKPSDIPAAPSYTYNTDWKGWGDWLGTRTRAEAGFYYNYEDAKQIVHTLKLKNH